MESTPRNTVFSNAVVNPLTSVVVPYETQLSQNWEWAMAEGSRFFDGTNKVYITMLNLARRLEELQIPYAVVGGMALTRYEYKRFTDDLDVLVTKESLDRIHEELEGRGYIPPFAESRHLRDTDTGVRVEFLVTGDFPGDGKPKPVAFPDPQVVAEEFDSIHFLTLPALIELKLASGMSNTNRGKDLIDVRELIVKNGLDRDYSTNLNPYVRDTFCQQWDDISANTTYLMFKEFDGLAKTPASWEELLSALPQEKNLLESLRNAGLELELSRTTSKKVWFKSNNPARAKKYNMHPSTDYKR